MRIDHWWHRSRSAAGRGILSRSGCCCHYRPQGDTLSQFKGPMAFMGSRHLFLHLQGAHVPHPCIRQVDSPIFRLIFARPIPLFLKPRYVSRPNCFHPAVQHISQTCHLGRTVYAHLPSFTSLPVVDRDHAHAPPTFCTPHPALSKGFTRLLSQLRPPNSNGLSSC